MLWQGGFDQPKGGRAPALIAHNCSLLIAATVLQHYPAAVAERHQQFWQKHPGLVWSNPEADDGVHIHAALLRPRFDRLLDIAVEFGLDRLRLEWSTLLEENTP